MSEQPDRPNPKAYIVNVLRGEDLNAGSAEGWADAILHSLRQAGYVIVHPDDIRSGSEQYQPGRSESVDNWAAAAAWDACRDAVFGGVSDE